MMCFISYIMCAEVIFCHLLILLIWHSKLIKGSYAIDDDIWFSVVNLFFFLIHKWLHLAVYVA